MLDNKWKHGKVNLVLPDLPPVFLESPGIKPVAVVDAESAGEEIMLLITEPESKISEFRGVDIYRFMLKVGLVRTSHGPVCFLLFYFPDPVTGNQVTYENSINPKDPNQVRVYDKLAEQEYWHVVFADDAGGVVNFFEFPNAYGLKERLAQVKQICEPTPGTDFRAAKEEYEAMYSIDELLEM